MRPLDLAVIGNCAVSSVVSPTGRHLWFCYPRFDADPVLNALLGGEDPERGFFDVTLRGQAASRQAYLPNSAVLETVLTDEAGASLRILDLAPRFKRYGRIYRPPSLLRRIEPISGRPRIRVRLRPTFEYGQRIPVVSHGSNHIRYCSAEQVLRLTTDAPLSHILYETEFGLDRPVNLVLGPDETLPESAEQHARTCLSETIAYWADWVRGLNVPFDWQEAVIRAAITLKLCSFEDTGAIVAALTTSVPEAPGSARNWDYRFCWLRDAFFTVSALNRLNATLTMEASSASCSTACCRTWRARSRRSSPSRLGWERRSGSRRRCLASWATGRCGWATPPCRSGRTTATARSSSRRRRCSSTRACRAGAMPTCIASSP
jgi:GH15 family glucan-1,4-alpha-glucosidase